MIFYLVLTVIWIVGVGRILNVYHNVTILLEAIYAYNIAQINLGNFDATLSYDRLHEWSKIFWRLNDWGYENILPREEYELIKPYIKESED